MLTYADQHGFDPDFSENAHHEHAYQLIKYVEKLLWEHNYLKRVKVYLSPQLPEDDAKQLLETLLRHGAAILSTPHVATHIIYPDPPGTREGETDDQVLCRMLAVEEREGDEQCLVHWMHHPDSYDDWVPRHEVLGHLHTPLKRNLADQWHLSARWVRDSDAYNEWMNELDYEMPHDFQDYIGRPPTDPKEARLISKYSRVRLRLRQPVVDKPPPETTDFGMVGLPTIGAENSNARPTEYFPAKQGTMDADEEVVDEGHVSDENSDKDEGVDGNGRVAIAEGLYMPSFANWFDTDVVNAIEKRGLPEFFEGIYASKTESTYREIRNFMIRTWRRTKSYLSGTAARRHLSGDACAILRVHGFLEHWGLINYGCEDAQQGSFNPPPKVLPLNAGIEYEFPSNNSTLLLDNGTKAELKGSKVLKQDWNGEPVVGANPNNFLIRESERSGHSQLADVEVREPIEYHCDSCGVDCSKLRFHCATKADVDLCASCYRSGRYASTMKQRDFIQMTSAGQFGGPEADDPDLWTESETLLLLEALEMYADNWQLVSEHVGSKNKNQCVTHFLRLPIEDTFLSTTRQRWWGERPSEEEGLPSPTQIMRTAGARDVSLAAATARGPTAKAYSGQPIIFGDQINTIVPLVSSIVNQSSSNMLRELTSVMDFDGSRRRIRRPFVDIVKKRCGRPNIAQDQQRSEEQDPDEESLETTDVTSEQIMSGSVYRELRRGVKRPAEVLESEYGMVISKAVSDMLRNGTIEPEAISSLNFENTEHDIHRVERETQKSRDGQATKSTSNDVEAASVEASRTATATASLIAACVTAAQMRATEDVELDRILSIVLEIRLEFIRRKKALLDELTRHIKFAETVRKRKRVNDAVSLSQKRLTRLEEADFANRIELVLPIDGEGAAPTLTVLNAVYGPDDMATLWTQQERGQQEPKDSSLPNFSGAPSQSAPPTDSNPENVMQAPTDTDVPMPDAPPVSDAAIPDVPT